MSTDRPSIPPSLWALLDTVGPAWSTDVKANSRKVIDGFSEILSRSPKVGAVTRDIRYGADGRQVLDVYTPPAARDAPVVIFIHGGGFVDGEKDRTPEIYSNVCWYLTSCGIAAINLEYRLAPAAMYPSGTEDVALAFGWVLQHGRRHGIDPANVWLMGHSAGAAHAGHFAYDTRFQRGREYSPRGVIVVSGRVRAENWPQNPNRQKVEAYYGSLSAMEEGSMATHVSETSPPTMIVCAEYESPLIDVHCAELCFLLSRAKARTPRFLRVIRHNHSSTIAQINTADDLVGPQIVEFIRTGK